MARSPRTTSPIITLTTDFGTRDHYVGAMKGAILSICDPARIVDVSHAIEPHDVRHGAFLLRHIWPYYPSGTIHVVVVDPGVGSARRILLANYEGRYVVAPDNGLLTFLHREFRLLSLHQVENKRYFLSMTSNTFHGRDVFAPVAAHLALGTRPAEFGRATNRLEILDVAHRATVLEDRIVGSALVADRFGNIVTNIAADQLESLSARCGRLVVHVNDTLIGTPVATFSDVPIGKPAAVLGGSRLLEIVCNQGSALECFGPRDALRVEVSGRSLPA